MRTALGTLLAIALLGFGSAASAEAAWHQLVGGASPINREAVRDATEPSVAEVAGTPYVAWAEPDAGGVEQIRAARLSAAGSEWERPGDSASPINVDPLESAEDPAMRRDDPGESPCVAFDESTGPAAATQIHMSCLTTATSWSIVGDSPDKDPSAFASEPSLTFFGGRTWVAWTETDSGVNQIRVAELPAPGTSWVRVPDTASPINADPSHDAFGPSLVPVGGDLYVAWSEEGAGGTSQVHVARLDTASHEWQKIGTALGEGREATEPSMADVGGVPYVAFVEKSEFPSEQVRVARLAGSSWELLAPASRINKAVDRDAKHPSLAAIGGAPYVSWSEPSEAGPEQIRVARLDAAGLAWERVVDTESPINHDPELPAEEPALTAIGGFPYLAWSEKDEHGHQQIRVGRLEPEFLAAGATDLTLHGEAMLTAEARTYGLPFPIGLDFGAALENELAPEPAPTGAGEVVTVSRPVSGLSQGASYQVRPFATAGLPAPRIVGAAAGFTMPTPSIPLEPSKPSGHKTPPPPAAAGSAPASSAPTVALPSARIAGASINSSRGVARFRFLGSGGVAGFRCSLAKTGRRAAFRSCRSPRVYRGLRPGRYVFQVRVKDLTGQLSSPVLRRFRIRG